MPKEYIRGLHDYFLTESSEPEEPVVCVRWGRESGDVSLVTRVKSAEIFYDEDPKAPIPVQYGFHVELDRRGINDLIRHLRRARDQALGRDE